MKIQFKKIDAIPENTRQIVENLYIDENIGAHDGQLEIYVTANGTDTVYNFETTPDETSGQAIVLVNNILAAIITNQIEGIEETDRNEIIDSLNKITGKLVEERNNFFEVTSNDIDPKNKIFFYMMNGKILYSDITKIPVDENIKNIDAMNQTVRSLQNLIRFLVTSETVNKVNEKGEVVDDEKIPVIDLAKREVDNFMNANNLKIDYSIFDTDYTTERERMIVRLMDVINIYQQIILLTNVVAAQNHVAEYYENILNPKAENIPAEEEDIPATDIPAEDVEVVEE